MKKAKGSERLWRRVHSRRQCVCACVRPVSVRALCDSVRDAVPGSARYASVRSALSLPADLVGLRVLRQDKHNPSSLTSPLPAAPSRPLPGLPAPLSVRDTLNAPGTAARPPCLAPPRTARFASCGGPFALAVGAAAGPIRGGRGRPRVAMARPERWGIAALLLAAALLRPARSFSLPLQRPADCGDARYFDISRLACGPCGAHQRRSAGGETRPCRVWGRRGCPRRGPCGAGGA